MSGKKRIAILTGGGDVPGLNVAIKAVVERAYSNNIDIVGIRRGWKGLMCIDPSDQASIEKWTMPLTVDNVRTIDRTAGQSSTRHGRTQVMLTLMMCLIA
jgi:6-phosphofructokinase 1